MSSLGDLFKVYDLANQLSKELKLMKERVTVMSALLDLINAQIETLNFATDAEWETKLAAFKTEVTTTVSTLESQLAQNAVEDQASKERIAALEAEIAGTQQAVLNALTKLNEGDATGATDILTDVAPTPVEEQPV